MTTHTKKSLPKYTPPICECCGQTTHYALRLDRGTALIVLALYNAIRDRKENRVHLINDMSIRNPKEGGFANYSDMVQGGKMTFRMVANASRARYHGLIAFVDEGSGEYLLTPKGAKFLHGEPVPRTAIIEKKSHHNVGYHHPEDTTTIFELLKDRSLTWDGQLAKVELAGIRGLNVGDDAQATLAL